MLKRVSGKTAAELLGVPDTPRRGRDRIIAAAIELFYARGFHAVAVHQAAAQYKREWHDRWRDLARRAGATDAGAEAFADLYTTVVEGTLLMRQVHGRDDAAQVSRPLAAALIEQYIPPRSPDAARNRRGAGNAGESLIAMDGCHRAL